MNNGLYKYPDENDYKKILDFYKNRTVKYGTVKFYLDEWSDGNEAQTWTFTKEEDKKIDNPTLGDIFRYEAGIGVVLYRNVSKADSKIYYSVNKSTEETDDAYKPNSFIIGIGNLFSSYKIDNFMCENINPRVNSYDNFYSVINGNVGIDRWKRAPYRYKDNDGWHWSTDDEPYAYATGIYTFKGDQAVSEFYDNNGVYKTVNLSNSDEPPIYNRIWIFHGASSAYSGRKSLGDSALETDDFDWPLKIEDPACYFPLYVEDVDVTKLDARITID